MPARLRVHGQPRVRREQVDDRLRGGQRHAGGDHRKQPGDRAAVGDQQQHDDDGERGVKQRAVDALERVAESAALPSGPVTCTVMPLAPDSPMDLMSVATGPAALQPLLPRLTWTMVSIALPSAAMIGRDRPWHRAVELG